MRPKVVIGIDPGKSGAIAIFANGLWSVQDCPTMKVSVNKRIKDVCNPRAMADILEGYPKVEVHVFLEKVTAMPGQGVTSMFTFGQSLGLWQGIIACLGLAVTEVTPAKWKRTMLAGMGKDKDASRIRAQQLFPNLFQELRLKKHHGRAESLLIAEYGRRSL